MAGTTTIKLRRKANLAAGLRKLDVLVDGKKIGNIFEVMVEGINEARGQVIGRTSQNITLNFTAAGRPPAPGSYVNVLVTKSFPNSLVGELVLR